MCKIPSESLMRIQGVGTMACGTAPLVNSTCAHFRSRACVGLFIGAFPENVAGSSVYTLEGTLNIRVITLINKVMAPRVGIEPTTNGLTVRCSTAELPGNRRDLRRARILRQRCRRSQGNRSHRDRLCTSSRP